MQNLVKHYQDLLLQPAYDAALMWRDLDDTELEADIAAEWEIDSSSGDEDEGAWLATEQSGLDALEHAEQWEQGSDWGEY